MPRSRRCNSRPATSQRSGSNTFLVDAMKFGIRHRALQRYLAVRACLTGPVHLPHLATCQSATFFSRFFGWSNRNKHSLAQSLNSDVPDPAGLSSPECRLLANPMVSANPRYPCRVPSTIVESFERKGWSKKRRSHRQVKLILTSKPESTICRPQAFSKVASGQRVVDND